MPPQLRQTKPGRYNVCSGIAVKECGMSVEQEIKKLRYQVKLLGEAINSQEHPIASMVIERNWGEDDVEEALDILEKYDKQLEKDGTIQGGQMERELRDRFQIGYQEVKPIILGFWRHHNFPDVCKAYAKQFECSEFHEITRGEEA